MNDFQEIEHDFESCGTRCAGTLYLPPAEQPRPVILLAHGLGATRALGLQSKAEEFARAGIAAFFFDYRSFGDSDGQPRNQVSIRGQCEDWQAAVDHVMDIPELDADRIILCGTSLSGGHVLSVAADDSNIWAVIASVPHLSGPATALMVKPRYQIDAFFRGIADLLGYMLFSKPHYSPVFAPDGEFSAESAPGNWDRWQKASSRFSAEWDNEIRSGFFLALPFYSPIRKIKRIRANILLVGATQDSITPIHQVRKAAEHAADCILHELACDHLELFMAEFSEKEFFVQLEFVRKLLAEEKE